MRPLTYEHRIQLLALAAGFPGSLIALILLWTGKLSSGAAWSLTFLIVALWFGFAISLEHRVVFSLQTLSNLLAALREEDFSLRARTARSDDAMGEVMTEVNALSETLRSQRLGALEASALLRTVMEEIDLAIFTFDNCNKLRLVNRAGERLLARPSERLLGFTAEELGLAASLEGEPARTMELNFPGGTGRWGMRRGLFRQGGLPHHLVVLSDLSRTLRDEERQAWQRLIRVLGHELNNSLAPIQSVAQGLESGLGAAVKSEELQSGPGAAILDDLRQGLAIIRSRTEALGRFMAAYARLARLPQPKLLPVNVAEWIKRTVKLETRVKVGLDEGPPLKISADADQLEQLLINLIRNAADAAPRNKGWRSCRMGRARRTTRSLDQGRWPGPAQHYESIRSLLHHKTRRLWYRPGTQPADCGSPRWRAAAQESHGCAWLRSFAAASNLAKPHKILRPSPYAWNFSPRWHAAPGTGSLPTAP